MFGLWEKEPLFPPPHQVPLWLSQLEKTIQGAEGPLTPEREGLEHLRGQSHGQREEGCPVLGGLSQTELVRLKSWKES